MAQSNVNIYFKSVIFTHLAFYLILCSASFLESQSHISIPIYPSLEATSDIQALRSYFAYRRDLSERLTPNYYC